jgi:ribonuclease D
MAMQEDRPPFRIFPNRIIPELVSAKPTDLAALLKVPDLPPACKKRYAEGMLAAIQQGLELPADELPRYPKNRRPPPDPEKQARLKRLKSWRSVKAGQLELRTGLICSNVVLDALAEGNPKNVDGLKVIPGMKAWQRKVFGQEIIRVI